MPVESAADRLVFLSADDFGTTASYVAEVGPVTDITGIFDAAHSVVTDGNASVSEVAPVFTCRTDDLDALPMGAARAGDDYLMIGSAQYMIQDVQPDGTGMTVLILERRNG